MTTLDTMEHLDKNTAPSDEEISAKITVIQNGVKELEEGVAETGKNIAEVDRKLDGEEVVFDATEEELTKKSLEAVDSLDETVLELAADMPDGDLE